MPWLVDGSNVLGAMRVDRHGEEGKRGLVRLLAAFARANRTRVSCVFDGPEPASFARNLGAVTVAFSGGRSADDVIAERAAQGRGERRYVRSRTRRTRSTEAGGSCRAGHFHPSDGSRGQHDQRSFGRLGRVL